MTIMHQVIMGTLPVLGFKAVRNKWMNAKDICLTRKCFHLCSTKVQSCLLKQFENCPFDSDMNSVMYIVRIV